MSDLSDPGDALIKQIRRFLMRNPEKVVPIELDVVRRRRPAGGSDSGMSASMLTTGGDPLAAP